MADEANPPKRPPSAYLIFMSDFREEYKVKNPEGFKKVTEVAKAGAAKWATMGPAAKKPYEDDAAERKSAFLKLYPDPIPRKRKQKGKKQKKIKDPNAPKRPLSAYLLFMADFRVEFMQKFPDTKKVADVAKAGAAKWATLSESEKKPYEDQAAVRKAEYTTAKEEYLKTKEI